MTRIRFALGTLGVLAVVAASAALVNLWGGAAEMRAPDLDGRTVTYDGLEVPSAEQIVAMNAVEDVGERFVVPSVGLDVALGEVSAVDGMLTPPGFTAAYQVRNMGVSADDLANGTLFVITHSVRDGRAPGNALIDVENQRATVGAGDRIDVAGRAFEVTDTRVVSKGDLPYDQDVWADTPNRLVVITCLQRTSGRSLSNLVVIAREVQGPELQAGPAAS